jgi:hypothetical protein
LSKNALEGFKESGEMGGEERDIAESSENVAEVGIEGRRRLLEEFGDIGDNGI